MTALPMPTMNGSQSPLTPIEPTSSKKASSKKQSSSLQFQGSPITIDEHFQFRRGRTYGAIFPEPIFDGFLIEEDSNLIPSGSTNESHRLDSDNNSADWVFPVWEVPHAQRTVAAQPGAIVKSWKVWLNTLVAVVGLLAGCLGFSPISYAAGENGAIDFSVPSDASYGDRGNLADNSDSSPAIASNPDSSLQSTLPPVSPPERDLTPSGSEPTQIDKAPPPIAQAPVSPSPDVTSSPFTFADPPPGDSQPVPDGETSTSPAPSVPTNDHSGGILDIQPASPAAPKLAPAPTPAPKAPSAPAQTSMAKSSDNLGDIFDGGSESLVARTVGHAEGTRNPDGSKTSAFQGHVDPGNGVWNLGSFSFQHCRDPQYNCSTAEQADVHQLNRLKGQADKLEQRVKSLGFDMTLFEKLNGIDLANQAPLAALGQPGYPEWLKQAREQGMKDEEAVLWARIKSYWDPNISGWNAPGLGNSESRIEHDQNRRMTAIARALDLYKQQVAAGKIPHEKDNRVASKPKEELVANNIIFQNLNN